MFKLPSPPESPKSVPLTLRTYEDDICEATKTSEGYYIRCVNDTENKLYVSSAPLLAFSLVFSYTNDGGEFCVSIRDIRASEDDECDFVFAELKSAKVFYRWIDSLQKSLRV